MYSNTRPFFDAGSSSPVEAFVAEAARHPVFRIVTEASAAEHPAPR